MGCDLFHLPTQAHTRSVGPSTQTDRMWSLFGRWGNSLRTVEMFVKFNRELDLSPPDLVLKRMTSIHAYRKGQRHSLLLQLQGPPFRKQPTRVKQN